MPKYCDWHLQGQQEILKREMPTRQKSGRSAEAENVIWNYLD